MTREPEKPSPFDAAELELLRSTLSAYCSSLTRALTYLDAKDESQLWVFKSSSLQTGLKTVRPFFDALEQSLHAAAAGNPITADTRKARKNRVENKEERDLS